MKYVFHEWTFRPLENSRKINRMLVEMKTTELVKRIESKYIGRKRILVSWFIKHECKLTLNGQEAKTNFYRNVCIAHVQKGSSI